MLRVKKIEKSYSTGDFNQQVLKGVSIDFRDSEFVAILGPSGSGKTTLLNLLGGLDQYDTGDIVVNNISTKEFKDKDWDAYRNNCVGFIFQSYNLITHISILANVEMALTLSGVSKVTRTTKAKLALEQVGLKDHMHKKPNQLSGGQMQRVAIARALVNDPQIILADEPTGALDTDTSVQIMELIKNIAKDKLVVMVTHNPELATEYANRIIEVKDGNIIKDSNPYEVTTQGNDIVIKKTSMSYLTALKLSFNNIKTKKGRTLLTSFASSIGIIGISLILALSNGFQIQIDNFERDSLSQMPIAITQSAMDISVDTMEKVHGSSDNESYPTIDEVVVTADLMETISHNNVITQDYVDYIDAIDTNLLSGISYQSMAALNVIAKDGDNYKTVSMSGTPVSNFSQLPTSLEGSDIDAVEQTYDILAGEVNHDEPGFVIIVNEKNEISTSILSLIGLSNEDYSFDDLLNHEVKLSINDEYYVQYGNAFMPNSDLEGLYNSDNSISVQVQAIIRAKEDKVEIATTSGIGYTIGLVEASISNNYNSAIVEAQRNLDNNIFSGEAFDASFTKEQMLAYLGDASMPVAIMVYPKDFESKDLVINYLDAYNDGLETENQVLYTDYASIISMLSGGIMSAITIVLIAFSSISLIVSSIMIGIITYISVLERTKEIGVLRALGARKKDITRVFSAETSIIGLFSGLLGIFIGYLLTIPANSIILSMTDLPNVAQLSITHASILIGVSMFLTIIGGLAPSKMAAKKDPVEALRSE